ncbi:MAG: copper chaperone PCu(A)C [Vicinamibacterales bacterium]
MKNLFAALTLVIALTTSVLARQATVTASDAWIVEPASGDTTAVAYLTVNNPTMYDVYVVSASTPAAEKVELRQGSGATAKVVNVITVASYGSAELKADAEHLALVNLKRPLKAGDTIDLTLKTDGGITLNVSAVVKKGQ